jgi:hypothetical protein
MQAVSYMSNAMRYGTWGTFGRINPSFGRIPFGTGLFVGGIRSTILGP